MNHKTATIPLLGSLWIFGGALQDYSCRAAETTPIHQAVLSYRDDNIIRALDSGLTCKTKDSKGDTPLHTAVLMYNLDAVELLLASGTCDVQTKNNEGKTPIEMAQFVSPANPSYAHAQKILKDIQGKLEKAGSKPVSTQKEPLLQEAVRYGDAPGVRRLLESGTPCNQPNQQGNTPLHVAVSQHDAKTVKTLLSFPQCDINALNAQGQTPFDLIPNVSPEFTTAYDRMMELRVLLRERGGESAQGSQYPELRRLTPEEEATMPKIDSEITSGLSERTGGLYRNFTISEFNKMSPEERERALGELPPGIKPEDVLKLPYMCPRILKREGKCK
jgi:hypothetical protein